MDDTAAEVARLRETIEELRAAAKFTILAVDVARAELLAPLRDMVASCNRALGVDPADEIRAALLREALRRLDEVTDVDLRERIRRCLGEPEE